MYLAKNDGFFLSKDELLKWAPNEKERFYQLKKK